jgi:pimeloyl-ACP methyl ester carboxylesterase
MQEGFAVTSYGRIHYLHEGRGQPLILLHSNGCSAYQYQDVLAPLARDHHVIALDMPGHGDSDPITRHQTVADYADAVIDFMDALGLDRASVLGSSVGGSICVKLGACHGERVDGLVIVETPARNAEEAAKQWPRTERNFGVATQTAEQIRERFRQVTPEFLTRWNIDRNKAGVKTMIDVMWALREYDVLSDLPKITRPALLIFGDRGPSVAKVDLFKERMPTAASEVMRDCGHFPMIDDPSGFVAVVGGFLAEECAAGAVPESLEGGR